MALAHEHIKTIWKDDTGTEFENRLDAAKSSAKIRISKLFGSINHMDEYDVAEVVIKNRRAIDEILIDLYAEENRK